MTSTTYYTYTDSSVEEGMEYFYRIAGVDEASNVGYLDSASILIAVTAAAPVLPGDLALSAHPNPSIQVSPSVSTFWKKWKSFPLISSTSAGTGSQHCLKERIYGLTGTASGGTPAHLRQVSISAGCGAPRKRAK
ncbi:MAG: hypothetical protein U5N26_01970 [Candidatus Marinimicrobia bacterium]|nr:hypothetical protein [Candidatus Neomarinimicrobiota bacterium]